MKFLLSLSFLLFTAASSINASSFLAGGPSPAPILDVTGAPLQFGVPYYMAPGLWAWGGGVTLPPPTPFQPCPKLIKLTPEVDRGTPVIFSSAVPSVTGNITTGSEFIISFYNLTRPNAELCGKSNSTTWVTTSSRHLAVGEEEKGTVFRLVSAGGVASSFYFLIPVTQFRPGFVVEKDEIGLVLVVSPLPELGGNLFFVFAKSTEEDEDDKPVIIQMPRKMSV